eukprot:TRINITY_DN1184_c2_g1_i1.p1 TRINITY_DN1184_c2_g1~~TRINITY_DN1184_c2_g1_i1.p1  ORF type:complete len:476 (+),score=61.81 TRINITY_DN1184_c2_g1_i1:59-1486(+)
MASTVDASRVAEHHEPPETLAAKLDSLSDMVQKSKYTVFYTGAGVSTSSGVGDYRGPSGAWTEQRIAQLRRDSSEKAKKELDKLLAEKAKEKRKTSGGAVNMLDATPSYTHMATVKLIQKNFAQYVVTTNLDGLYRKAGLEAHTQVCFLHGDVYTERCTACGYEFERNYEVRRVGIHVHDHAVGTCEKCKSAPPPTYTGRPVQGTETGSGVKFETNGLIGTRDKNVGTKDTHINFGEVLDVRDWNDAAHHCKKADLCIVMGTSMSLRHITHFPFQAKKTVIVNLQATPDDAKCDLRIWTTCDELMEGLMQRLSLDIEGVPVWRPKDALPISQLRRNGVHSRYIEAAVRLEEFTKSQEQYAKIDAGVVLPAASAPPMPREVEVTLTNDISQPAGDGMIPWAVTLNDPCDSIANVTFKLHPTFTPTAVTLHAAPFTVSRRGWGEFVIEITINLRNGGVRTINHKLCLSSSTVKRFLL